MGVYELGSIFLFRVDFDDDGPLARESQSHDGGFDGFKVFGCEVIWSQFGFLLGFVVV